MNAGPDARLSPTKTDPSTTCGVLFGLQVGGVPSNSPTEASAAPTHFPSAPAARPKLTRSALGLAPLLPAAASPETKGKAT